LRTIREEGSNWLAKIPEIQFKLNSRYDASRKLSPFQTVYGFNPKARPATLPYPQPIYLDAPLRHTTASGNLNQAKINQTTQANKHRTPEPKLNIGQKVLLSTDNITISSPNSKPKYIGPFKVTTINHWFNNYSLDFTEHPDLQLIHNKFHISELKPYHTNDPTKFPNRQLHQPPAVEGERFKVSKVLEFRSELESGKRQYKVRWAGYSPKYDEWVNAEDIDHDLLEDYWMYGKQDATLARRPFNTKPWSKRKTGEEIREMIRSEREKIIRSSNQKIVVCVKGKHRPIKQKELDRILRSGTLSVPIAR